MIKLVKFHLTEGGRIFINPANVCSVYENDGSCICMLSEVKHNVKEPLFDVIAKLTHTGKGKPIIQNPCKGKS